MIRYDKLDINTHSQEIQITIKLKKKSQILLKTIIKRKILNNLNQ